MKKFFVRLALVCTAMALICTSAFAAINVTSEKDYVTLTVEGDTVKVTVTGVPEGSQVLALALSSSEGVPTADNIRYIDQDSSSDSGVSFTIYPNPESLESGSTYYIYLSSNAADGNVGALERVGSFVYTSGEDEPAPSGTRGDLNGDSAINALDALQILRHVSGKINLAVADADLNGDGVINALDALQILRHVSGKINLAE